MNSSHRSNNGQGTYQSGNNVNTTSNSAGAGTNAGSGRPVGSTPTTGTGAKSSKNSRPEINYHNYWDYVDGY